MPFELFADVILTRDVANRGPRAGDVGTVVERHTAPGMTEEGYTVEFLDMTGNNTVAVVTVPVSVLRVPTPADRPSAQRVVHCSVAFPICGGTQVHHPSLRLRRASAR
jgi:hypothetical protein